MPNSDIALFAIFAEVGIREGGKTDLPVEVARLVVPTMSSWEGNFLR